MPIVDRKYSTYISLHYREERVLIRNSEIDCRIRMFVNLRNQSVVRFERIVSGRFSPLTIRSRDLPLPLHRICKSRSAPNHPIFGPASLHFLFPLPLRSHALLSVTDVTDAGFSDITVAKLVCFNTFEYTFVY